MLFKSLCLAALVSTAAAAVKCGPGTVLVNEVCTVESMAPGYDNRNRREDKAAPTLQTTANDLVINVDDKQKGAAPPLRSPGCRARAPRAASGGPPQRA